MSFGFSQRSGAIECAGEGLDTVFAQRRNLLRPDFLCGVLDILRFNRLAARHLDEDRLADLSLGAWLRQEGFSRWLRECYMTGDSYVLGPHRGSPWWHAAQSLVSTLIRRWTALVAVWVGIW